LVSPTYLFALIVLLLNDFVLKSHFAGFVTGKLSDFAGLFAAAVFLLVITRRSAVLVALVLCFAFWKSPFSGGVIRIWNSATGFSIGRTVDPTDLIALSVIPLALSFYCAAKARNIARSWCQVLSSLVSLFAFVATSQAPTPKQQAAFHAAVAEFTFSEDQPSYTFSLDRRSLYSSFETCGFYVSGSTAIFPNPGKHSANLIPPRSPRDHSEEAELFGVEFDVDSNEQGVIVRVTKLSITRNGHSISRADAIRIFESQVVAPLRHTDGAFPQQKPFAAIGAKDLVGRAIGEYRIVNGLGGMQSKGRFVAGFKEGLWTFWDSRGTRVGEINYHENVASGEFRLFYSALTHPGAAGQLKTVGQATGGHVVGEHIGYDIDGTIISRAVFGPTGVVTASIGTVERARALVEVDQQLFLALDQSIRKALR
jgi:hypothetical protein